MADNTENDTENDRRNRYIGYVLYAVIGVLIVSYSIYEQGFSTLLLGSIAVMPATIGVSEKLARSFSYPLFFVRNELNYWGGGFGGVVSMIFYVIFLVIGHGDMFTLTESLSIGYSFVSLFFIMFILHTGTILRDVELGYVDGE